MYNGGRLDQSLSSWMKQESRSAVASMPEQPFLGSALLTPNGGGARKGALKIVCFITCLPGKPHSGGFTTLR